MARYTSNKKISEMKPNKWSMKKALSIVVGGVSALAIAGGFTQGHYFAQSEIDTGIRENPMEFKTNSTSPSHPVLSKYLNDNKKSIDQLRMNFYKYKGYHDMKNRSTESQEEMDELVDKITSPEAINTVVQFALNTAKAQVADAYKLKSSSNLTIKATTDPSEAKNYTIINKETNELLFKSDINWFNKSDSEKMKLHDTIERLMDLQNLNFDNLSKSQKIQRANYAYGLYNSTIKTANATYIAKNGKFMEVGEPKVVTPTLIQKVKDTDDERGL